MRAVGTPAAFTRMGAGVPDAHSSTGKTDRQVGSGHSGASRSGLLSFATAMAGEDAAVRFDARPIVGPVAEPASTAASRLSGAATPPRVQNRPMTQVPGMAALTEAIATAVCVVTTKPADCAPVATGRSERVASARVNASAAGDPARMMDARVQPGRSPATPATFARLGSPAPGAAVRSPETRVVVLADEIRVSVRGATLTEEEGASLSREVRELLAGTALAGHRVRLTTARRT